MKTNSIILVAWTVVGFCLSTAAQTASLKYLVEYKCNGERLKIYYCRSDDQSRDAFPVQPQNDYCSVEYPDRPSNPGYVYQASELRGELIKKLQACGALQTAQPKTATQPAQAGNSADGYLAEGDRYRDTKNYDKAIESYKKAIELKADTKTSSEANRRIGALYNFQKRPADALPFLQEAVRLNPDSHLANYNLANSYRDLKKYPESLTKFQRAVQLKPDEGIYVYMLGLTYTDLGKKNEALQVAASLEKNNQKGYAGLLYDVINKMPSL